MRIGLDAPEKEIYDHPLPQFRPGSGSYSLTELLRRVDATLQAAARDPRRFENCMPGVNRRGETGFDVTRATPIWSFTRMGKPSRRMDPMSPSYDPFDQDSPLISDELAANRYLDQCRAIRDHLSERIGDAGPGAPEKIAILRGEYDAGRKIMVQRGRTNGWFIGEFGAVWNAPFPDDLISALDAVLDVVLQPAHAALVADEDLFDPVDTNCGWPIFSNGPFLKLLAPLLLGRMDSVERIAQAATELAQRLSIPGTAGAFAYGTRTQGTAKAVPLLRGDACGAWDEYGSVTSMAPRTRRVFMACSAFNLYLRPIARAFKGGRKACPGAWHAGDVDALAGIQAGKSGAHVYESDLSGYDTSISERLKFLLWSRVIHRRPDLTDQVRLWALAESTPVLGPSIYPTTPTSGRKPARAFYFPGGIRSGLKMTSEIGTVINLAIGVCALKRCGVIPEHRGWHKHVKFLTLGDDTWIASSKRVDEDLWVQTYADVGVKAEFLHGRRMLMRHLTTQGSYPVATRILQQSAFPEYGPKGRSGVGIAMLGLVARLGRGIHPSMDEEFFLRPLLTLNWVRDARLRSVRDVKRYLASDRAIRIMSEAVDDYAAKAAVMRARRDAEYSSSAAQLWSHAVALRPEVAKQMVAMERQINIALNGVASGAIEVDQLAASKLISAAYAALDGKIATIELEKDIAAALKMKPIMTESTDET